MVFVYILLYNFPAILFCSTVQFLAILLALSCVAQVTHWLQGLFQFSIVWSIGSTVTGVSRKGFDEFFRGVLNGVNPTHPKPKSCKITKVPHLSLPVITCMPVMLAEQILFSAVYVHVCLSVCTKTKKLHVRSLCHLVRTCGVVNYKSD